MKKILFPILLFSALCCGCHESEPSVQGADSTDVRIALLPIDDCQPIITAYNNGLLDSLGFSVRADVFKAAMDLDTAVLRGHANMFITDTVRLARLLASGDIDSAQVNVLRQWRARYQLLTVDTNIVALRHLREKTVAMTRHSALHRLFERMQQQGNMKDGDCFCVQVNDIELRRQMMLQGLVDAAFLPHPQADSALAQGAHRLVMSDSTEVFALVYIGKDRANAETILTICGQE